MSKQITIFTIILSALALNECSLLNAITDKLGANFWLKKILKTPCKIASSQNNGVIWVASLCKKADEAELTALRGNYSTTPAFSPDAYAQRNEDYGVNLAL